MFSRIHFFSITLGIFAVLTATFLFPTSASAWAPTASPPWTGDLEARLDTALAGSSVENWRELNYATANYDGSSFLFFVGDDTQFSIGDGGSGYTSFNGRLCRWYYDVGTSPGCNPLNSSYGLSSDTVYSLHLSDTFATNQPTQYGWIEDNYEELITAPGNPLDPENNNTPRCQPWDVVCWFSATVDSVVDGFQSLANFFGDTIKALGEWIANLIMPSNADGGFDNRFTDFFTTVQDTMNERLGFLLFPFEFIADLIASLTTIYNPFGGSDAIYGNCTSGSQLSVPNLLGENSVGVNLCGIEDTPIWEPAVLLLRFVWIVGVVGFLHHKYFSVVKA